VEVNREAGKPHRQLRVGDEIGITRPFGRRQIVKVTGFVERHVPRAEARALYEDITPPPSPEDLEMRRLDRLFRRAAPPSKPTDKRVRRALRRLKGH
jgi:ribosome-associated heat shock protein Hsp15